MKNPLASKTIWGAIIAIAPQLLALFGVTDQDIVTSTVSILGGLFAIYGRVVAKLPAQ